MTWKKPAASFGRRVSPVRVLSSPVTENLPTTPCHWQLAHNPPSLATCPQSPITGNLPAIPRHWQLARNPPSLTTCPQSPGTTEPSPSEMEVGTSVFRLDTPELSNRLLSHPRSSTHSHSNSSISLGHYCAGRQLHFHSKISAQ